MIDITILGFGHIGHALCALLGMQHAVNLTVWSRQIAASETISITAVSDNVKTCVGKANLEPNFQKACASADIIIVATPVFAAPPVIKAAYQLAHSCRLLVIWEGTGSSVRQLEGFSAIGPAVIGLQRSPVLARIRDQGTSVEILGIRSRVVAAFLQNSETRAAAMCHRVLQFLLPCEVDIAPSYDCVTLSPGNPLIHPARLCRYGQLAAQNACLPKRFYSDWDNESSEILLGLHQDLKHLRDHLEISPHFVTTFFDRLTCVTPQIITSEIRNAACLKGVCAPLRRCTNSEELDGTHRFFRDDVCEGLKAITELAKQAEVHTPNMERVLAWGQAQI